MATMLFQYVMYVTMETFLKPFDVIVMTLNRTDELHLNIYQTQGKFSRQQISDIF